MKAILDSFLLIAASEMGDKTQILSLILVSRFRKPWVILAGVFAATVVNHAIASWLGGWISMQVSPQILAWGLSSIFFVFGIWILFPDKEDGLEVKSHFGVFMTTAVAFFLAEMGDKTQLATMALGARFHDPVGVTIGSTAGMLFADALVIFLGEKITKRIPMQWIRRAACVLFILFAIGILIGL